MAIEHPHAQYFIYKHSPTCGRSMRVIERVQDFAAAHPDVRIEQVDVLAERPRSQRYAAEFGIEHESPQVILVQDGAAVWHASHWAITREAMEAALDGVRA